ncbi:MAG: LuxR C-terminal-related transcriptional regulator [Anaerolineales bacterium]
MIQTIIVAPALAMRAGLRAMLQAAGDFEIVSEAARLTDLLPASGPVDLLIVQPALGEGITSLEELVPPDAAVLLLSDEPAQVAALSAGGWRAWGVLPTDCRQDELLAALCALEAGLAVAPSELLAEMITARPQLSPGDDYFPDLTERELQVLDLLADGYANKQISAELGISEHTVKFHVSSIYTKLNVSNRAEAVRIGIQNGLIVI